MAELSFAHDPAERSRSARRQHRSREGQRAPRDFALAGHYGLAAETVADWGKKTAGPLPSSDDPWGTLVAGSVPHTEAAIDDTEPGEALAPEIRERLERRLGYDLGRVRLYTRHKAQRATSELGARAFAFGERIFLRHPKERSDLKLLAHELTHSVQQGALGRSPSAPTRNSAMAGAVRPSTGAAGVRQQDPHRVAGATATPSPATHPSQGATQGAAAGGPLVQGSGIFDAARSLAGRVVSRAGRTVGTVVETVGNLAAGTRNAALSTVRRLFPNAYALFMEGGISGFLRRLIGRAVRSVRDAVRSRLRDLIGEDNFSALGEFAGVMGQIVGDLAQNNCSTVLRLARRFGDFMRRTFAPIVNRVRCWGRQLSTFISGLWDSIAGPVWSFIQDIGGPLWESVRGFMASLGTQLRRLRAWLGASWETVKGWLGIEAEGGEAEGGGIWNWITSVASDIWAGLRETLRPVMGPLRVVGGIFLALSPVGPLLAVILLWPRLQQAFSWLSARWDDFQGLLGQAREFFANTVLPQLLDGAQSMANLLADGAAWLIDKLNSITGLLARLASDQLRNSPFAPLASIVDFFRGRLQARLNGLKQGIRRVAGATRSGILRLIALGRRVLAVLIEILAVVLNPFGIAGFLLGMAWRLLPECLKGPIINFVVNLLIGVIEFLPPLFPPLGLLWPFIQQGLLGFLREVQCQPTDRKVRLANKVASIISGGSVEFFLGFMRGLVVGVLEGIFSPLTTIAQIFELPTMIRTFLQSLSLSFSQLVQRVRCLLRDMGQRAMGTLSDILTELSALLTDPGRVIALIGQAICSALNTVRGLGRSLATQMFQFFEQPDSQIGNSVGRAAGNLLVDAIYAFFSAGSTSVLSALRPVLNALGSVGRTILRSAQQLVGHLRRLTREVRRMVDTFVSRARTAASGAMARLKAFFGRIFAWFQGTFRGLFRRVAGNVDDRLRWRMFEEEIGLLARRYSTTGVSRQQLRRDVRSIRRRYRDEVASADVRHAAKGDDLRHPFERKGPYWIVTARRKGTMYRFLPAAKFEVLQIARARWPRAVDAVMRRIRGIRRGSGTLARVEVMLPALQRHWRFSTLTAKENSRAHQVEVAGSMNPNGLISTVPLEPAGTLQNPIPVHWYKPASDYDQTFKIWTDARHKSGPKTPVDWHNRTDVHDLQGRQHTIGVTPRFRMGDGICMRRSSTPRGADPEMNRFHRVLHQLGYDWHVPPRQPDHIIDRAFQGDDDFDNLWPLAAATNQQAFVGRWYSRHKISFSYPQGAQFVTERNVSLNNRRFRSQNLWVKIVSSGAKSPPTSPLNVSPGPCNASDIRG